MYTFHIPVLNYLSFPPALIIFNRTNLLQLIDMFGKETNVRHRYQQMQLKLPVRTSRRELAVNLRVDFFVSKVAPYFFNCLSHDGDNQNEALEGDK